MTHKEEYRMTINNKGILPAIGLGMVAGAALSMIPKKDLKRKAEKAAKTVGEAVEHFTEAAKM